MAARGNDRVAARNRARERRLTLDAERRASEGRVDDAVVEFDLASAEREAALGAVAACEIAMGTALARVLVEGESMERAAALCDTNASEVRRLARLAPAADSATGIGIEANAPASTVDDASAALGSSAA